MSIGYSDRTVQQLLASADTRPSKKPRSPADRGDIKRTALTLGYKKGLFAQKLALGLHSRACISKRN